MVDKAKWAARWAGFKTKAGATKQVWRPPKPATKTKVTVKKAAKKTTKKASPHKRSR